MESGSIDWFDTGYNFSFVAINGKIRPKNQLFGVVHPTNPK
jgi:hypothetical protein